MKKIISFIKKNKIAFITFLILCYGLLLRIYLPFHIPIHENNHGIFFINNLYNLNLSLDYVLDSSIFVKDMFIEQMNYGLVPKVFYHFLIKNFNFTYKAIFIIQIILNLLTILFVSLGIYKFSGKKILYYISLILGVVLPYNIKFSSTEEFLIIGNCLMFLSFYLCTLFFEKEKYKYFYFSLVFYALALYTRNLYLILSIFYILLFVYYLFTKKFNYKKLFINFFLGLAVFFVLIYSRIKIFLFTRGKNSNSLELDNILDLPGFITSPLTPNIYIYSIILGILLPILFFWKYKNKYKNIIFYYIFIILTILLLLLTLTTTKILLLQERLQNIFVPFFILISSVGLFFLLFKFKYKYVVLFIFLLVPFFYTTSIKNLYSPQMDYVFLEDNINKLGDKFNLIILGHSENSVFNNFPEFLIKNKDYKIIGMDSKDNRYISFIDNYGTLKNENNYFILSYDCYRGNNIGKKMRKECENIENRYNLEVISEKYIDNKPYIFGNSSSENKLKIGIYKIISKKYVTNNAQG